MEPDYKWLADLSFHPQGRKIFNGALAVVGALTLGILGGRGLGVLQGKFLDKQPVAVAKKPSDSTKSITKLSAQYQDTIKDNSSKTSQKGQAHDGR